MPKYLFKASYTPDGVAGLRSHGGTSRRDAVTRVVESVGGTLETFYFGFGEYDSYVIADLPDNEAATAIALRVKSAGGASIETVVLITAEQVDAAAQRSPDYRPPAP
jgi:uncharacterized protein with GYD domain